MLGCGGAENEALPSPLSGLPGETGTPFEELVLPFQQKPVGSPPGAYWEAATAVIHFLL